MRPSRPLVAVVLLASLTLAGCGWRGSHTTSAAPASPTSSPTTAPAPAPPTTGAPPATVTPTTGVTDDCAETHGWGTAQKQSARSSTAPLYLVRVGQHDCYDRVVFAVNSADAVGCSVRYVNLVTEDASGRPVPVAGAAALQVVVRAPALGLDDQGHEPGRVLAEPRADFYTAAQLAGWQTLREVRYAGSFEGQTTIAVGVRARVPFRVFTLLDSGDQVMRVVLDVAR